MSCHRTRSASGARLVVEETVMEFVSLARIGQQTGAGRPAVAN
ncbi:hypothetical protein ACFVYD_28390 [Streptomyces sp. NPDC058301]